MAQKFDFNDIGKRMPYTMPAETFGDIETKVLAALNKDRQTKRKRRILRWSSIGGIAAAASVALLLMIKPLSAVHNDPLTQIDLAFGNLSEADQEYLVEIYHEDFFLNQIQKQANYETVIPSYPYCHHDCGKWSNSSSTEQ